MDTCSFPECGRPVFVKQTSHGPLCNGHYAQHKHNKLLQPLRAYTRHPVDASHNICPFDGCGRPSWHRIGFCQSHQRQYWAASGTDAEKLAQLTPVREHLSQVNCQCAIEGCNTIAKTKGFCAKHFRVNWGTCIVENCTKQIHNKRKQLCINHYREYKKDFIID